MTTIVAVASPKGVFIGADTQATEGAEDGEAIVRLALEAAAYHNMATGGDLQVRKVVAP